MVFLLFSLVKLLFLKKSGAKVQRFKSGRRDSKSIEEKTDVPGMTRLSPWNRWRAFPATGLSCYLFINNLMMI
jgi:hypothetical protein